MSVKTYELIPKPNDGAAIQCLVCGLTSHNPNDRLKLYCGNCHAFHQDMSKMADTLDEIREIMNIHNNRPKDYGKMTEIYRRVRENLDLTVIPREHTGSYTREQQLPPEPLQYTTLEELREKVDESVSGHLKAYGDALHDLPAGESLKAMKVVDDSVSSLTEMVKLQLAAYMDFETSAKHARKLMNYRQELANRLLQSDDLFENQQLRHTIEYINKKLRTILAL